jgi:hydroxymethylpyrimidine pyrophosphatase-like HAD family hydrolase
MGDYINDMEMLRAADIAVCPANSHEDVKGMCDIVTEEDCEHGAVARALRTVCSMTQG